jgi:nucleotide-binding universal stress UspA family protein
MGLSLTVELEGKRTGEAILATASSLNCDLLIKGAYTQSRLRQIIFGGTTRHIMKNAGLPVLFCELTQELPFISWALISASRDAEPK